MKENILGIIFIIIYFTIIYGLIIYTTKDLDCFKKDTKINKVKRK